MNIPSVSFPFSLLCLTMLILFLSSFFPSHAHDPDGQFSRCEPFDCGDKRNISYPFRGKHQPDYCGHPGFVVECETNPDRLLLNITSQTFLVHQIDTKERILKISRVDYQDSICPKQFSNTTTLNSTPFHYTSKDRNTTLFYDCEAVELFDLYNFSCGVNNFSRSAFFVPWTDLESYRYTWRFCNVSVVVPVMVEALKDYFRGVDHFIKILRGGFEVVWDNIHDKECRACIDSGGRCGNNNTVGTANEFICLCPHQKGYGLKVCGGTNSDRAPARSPTPAGLPNSSGNKRDWRLKTAIGIAGGVTGVILMCIVFFLYQRRKRKQKAPRSLLSRDISSDISSVKNVEKESTYLGVHLFTYEELVEATNCFDSSKELGDGGFGTVYYGKLHDGRVVAVKRLYENNYRRVEQFMNEVGILARMRHKNLVSLYGCTSRHGHELLLVYEYIPNGTVSDHLHGQRAKPGALPWDIRLNIAIETASALTYLHASDVIHRDVKTNNILLDNNFSVKVADFGLSRLFPLDVTHISTAPQGTPGYVDPDYHQCYQLTSKSDVFSFGVVLMELVSSMPAVDITRHRHDINLSTMAMNRIQNHALHELVDPNLGFDRDSRVRKMITAVAELAFQCLQQEKDMRPCMVDVLEELKAIQSRDYGTDNKAEKIDNAADEAVLLKSGALTLSPDTVTINWTSTDTTPNASG